MIEKYHRQKMPIDFRTEAQKHLALAKKGISANTDNSIRTAALSLRMVLEALVYERAGIYKEELSSEDYETWQPRLLIKRLLEIDPYADQSSTIAISFEETPGQPAKKMQSIGKEVVLDLKTINKHYDALGSFLHMPTLKQVESGQTQNTTKLKARCEEVAVKLEKVLSSNIFKASIGVITDIECAGCGKPVRRRYQPDGEPRQVACFECGAEYSIQENEHGDPVWHPQQTEIKCPNESCGVNIHFWKTDIQLGNVWSCPQCEKKFEFRMAIAPYKGGQEPED